MTPKRKEWWDSLPAEEKRVRREVGEFKRAIKYYKKHLIPYIARAKYHIRYSKKAIKALRKQVAMCPQVVRFSDVLVRQPRLKCPCCSHRFILHTPYCGRCGQKLRWK